MCITYSICLSNILVKSVLIKAYVSVISSFNTFEHQLSNIIAVCQLRTNYLDKRQAEKF